MPQATPVSTTQVTPLTPPTSTSIPALITARISPPVAPEQEEADVAMDDVLASVEMREPSSPSPINPIEQEQEQAQEQEQEQEQEEGASFFDNEEEEEIAEEEDLSEHEDESPPKDGASTGIVLSSGASLSVQEWEEMKKNNPAEALEARLGSKTSSSSKPSVSTLSAGVATSATSTEALLSTLRTQILDGDIFQTIEANPPLAFQIKDLLHKLAELDVDGALNESVSDFVLAVQPLFEQLARDIQRKREHDHLLELESKRKVEMAALVDATHANFASLKTKSEAEMKTIEDCDIEIRAHQESIAKLQSKIQALEKKKGNLLRSLTPAEKLKDQIDQEATLCLKHLEDLERCNATVEKLTKDGNFLNRKISKAKALFNDLKSKVIL